MKPYTVEVVDSLSLLSMKVASNVFDLSSGLHHVSIRDQMVRAQLAIRDLKRGHPDLSSILIVGAGVAGIAAALEAVKRGVEKVVVVEVAGNPFETLSSTRQRYVGPFMYEWPSQFSQNQSYPAHHTTPWIKHAAAPLHWKSPYPVRASRLARMLTQGLTKQLNAMAASGRSPLTICVHVSKNRIAQFVKEFAKNESARAVSRLQHQKPVPRLKFGYWHDSVWPRLTPAHATIDPEYIFLAAGMGKETVRLVSQDKKGSPYTGKNYDGIPFWRDDNLIRKTTANRHVSVFGGGDGALQDVLRALTHREHPLKFINHLNCDPATKSALDKVRTDLLSADRQARQFGAWTVRSSEYRTVDTTCKKIAKEMAGIPAVVQQVSKGIAVGGGTVSLFVRGEYFDKSYLLNRFLVHLIRECQKKGKLEWAGRVRFRVYFRHRAAAYSAAPKRRHTVEVLNEANNPPSSFSHVCDVISVRYGIQPGTVPGAQLIQVSNKRSRQRTTLARVELPFVAEKD